ncbi:MAG TPA: glycosyltransferase family 4 protein [Acidimicrobiales bacterium]|nr:glycosyltransferase family 4 protein [Acidimicrobiales bacterium]
MRGDGGVNAGSSRILILCGDLSAAGGAERLVFEEAEGLRSMGYDVIIATYRIADSVRFSGRYQDRVEVLSVPTNGRVARLFRAAAHLTRLLRWWRPNLVIAMSSNDCVHLMIPSLLTRTVFVTHINGTQFWFPPEQDMTKYAWVYRHIRARILTSTPGHREFVKGTVALGLAGRARIELTARLHRAAVRRAQERITFSRMMASEVELIYGRSALALKGAFPERILTYEPQTDPCSPFRSRGLRTVLNINRLEPRKRVDLAIRAFELVHRDRPDSVMLIGGVGPSATQLESLVDQLGLEESVVFLGFVDENELWDWMATCDVFIHPNWADFAIAPFEALGLGTNVVWSTEMEMDPELTRCSTLHPASPDRASMASAIHEAFDTNRAAPEERLQLRAYTWEGYFSQLGSVVSRWASQPDMVPSAD